MLALRSQRPLNIAHAHGVDMQQRRGAGQLRDEDESYIDAPGKAVSAEGRSAPITAGRFLARCRRAPYRLRDLSRLTIPDVRQLIALAFTAAIDAASRFRHSGDIGLCCG